MPPASVPKPFGFVTSSPASPRARPRTGFEISLLGSSLRALAARRRDCVHCHRTPLIGEMVFFYGERLVCELCRPLRRDAPGRAELVHSPERDLTVKRLASR